MLCSGLHICVLDTSFCLLLLVIFRKWPMRKEILFLKEGTILTKVPDMKGNVWGQPSGRTSPLTVSYPTWTWTLGEWCLQVRLNVWHYRQVLIAQWRANCFHLKKGFKQQGRRRRYGRYGHGRITFWADNDF